jgi:hypothetical protein
MYSLTHSKVPPLWSGDFLAFYATSKIALSKGFSQVYNLQFQRQYQLALYPQSLLGLRKVNYVTTPMSYLPAFILLFTPFSFLNLSTVDCSSSPAPFSACPENPSTLHVIHLAFRATHLLWNCVFNYTCARTGVIRVILSGSQPGLLRVGCSIPPFVPFKL